MMNAGLKFICREVNLRIETTQSEFTGKYRKGQTIRVPVAHHEGNYTLATDDVKRLEDADRIAFRYADHLGNEIGRAYCRGRACQYVYISVVAVSLKKKTKNS